MIKRPYYEDFFIQAIHKVFKPVGNVIHRAICPECGKNLVNLYRCHNEWLCRTCRDAKNGGEKDV